MRSVGLMKCVYKINLSRILIQKRHVIGKIRVRESSTNPIQKIIQEGSNEEKWIHFD